MKSKAWARVAAWTTIAGVVVWVAVVIFLSILTADTYNSVKQPGSELALGRLGILMDIAFFVLGFGVAALGFGLSRSLDHALVVSLLL